MSGKFKKNYNERLFGNKFKNKLHSGRFEWLSDQIIKFDCKGCTMLELGCYDGKTLDYLDVKPQYYRGYDANWENGLDIGRKKWQGVSGVDLLEAKTANDMDVEENSFDVSCSLETLEHVPTTEIDPYVKKIAFATKKYFFITVPNEQGIFFLFKHIVKKLTNNQQESYTVLEFINAVLGRIEKVERIETGHKGFISKYLISVCEKHFRKVQVVGLPFKFLPTSFNFAVAIVCEK